MNLRIYIDGDNICMQKLRGIELLCENDEVIIYTNSVTGVYPPKKIDSLNKKCKCKIILNRLPMDYKNAVDFALAVSLHESEKLVLVISGDNDLRQIVDMYCYIHQKQKFKPMLFSDMQGAILAALPVWATEDKIKEVFYFLYGDTAEEVVASIRQTLNMKSRTEEKPKTIFNLL